ncbi:multidrug effflux MFS transporter [Mesorhizobium sp. YR577]|uniref:multidrug effflux MFS transporter n=1 Tax=Mesorhizobium sp. YR577 TaxID=1884373 RepID=UPI0008E7B4EC|nr:multidrug effflux MFS transporter [Mesorhizobium sp. YR577]SFT79154.1 MFS transporter, DHA1 family, bicyclomycin/chloramphenicol resistance protein [Mesorhizobium sp. YR577]
MAAGFLNKATPPHVFTLVTAAAASTLSMNIFLPSLPGMAKHFDAEYAVVQLAVSLYLAATAVLQLFIGPASDRFGRRPVMLFCFALFILGTVAAIYAPTIELLLACRLLQASSAAGMVLSRAIVRDTVEATEAASKIGYITMGTSLVPMIGPIIGGFLDELYGWQATFLLMLAAGLFAFVIVWLDLGETNRQKSSSFAAQFRSYPEVIGSRRFWGYTLTAAFTSGAFFAFLGGGPYISSEILHLTPSQYGMYFAIVSIGYMLGNFMSGRFSRTVGINRMMLYGNIVTALGMMLSIALFWSGYNHPLSLFGPVFFVGVGNGVTLPNANAGIVTVSSHLAGSASGLGGALQIGGGAALSVVAGALLTPDTGPYPLLWVMLLSALAGALSTLYVMWVSRHPAREA